MPLNHQSLVIRTIFHIFGLFFNFLGFDLNSLLTGPLKIDHIWVITSKYHFTNFPWVAVTYLPLFETTRFGSLISHIVLLVLQLVSVFLRALKYQIVEKNAAL